jgi:hypothetical protein
MLARFPVPIWRSFLQADFWPPFIIRLPEMTSALPVTLHQRTQPARDHPRVNEDENVFDPTFYGWAPATTSSLTTANFGILALESFITGDPLVSPAR